MSDIAKGPSLVQRKQPQSADIAEFAAYNRIRPWRSEIIYSYGKGRSPRSISIEFGRRCGTGARNAVDRIIQEDYIETKRENARLRGERLMAAMKEAA